MPNDDAAAAPAENMHAVLYISLGWGVVFSALLLRSLLTHGKDNWVNHTADVILALHLVWFCLLVLLLVARRKRVFTVRMFAAYCACCAAPLAIGVILQSLAAVLTGADWNYVFVVLWIDGPPFVLTALGTSVTSREARARPGT